MPEEDSKVNPWICPLVSAGVIGGILLVVLLPLSLPSVAYYDYGFKRSRTTGTLHTDKVYTFGRYFTSPDTMFQTYPATGQVFTYNALSVVTQDKLETKLDVTMVYFLTKDQLHELQKEYNLNYHSAIESNAISAIKNAATRYTTAQFFTNHTLVQRAMHEALHALEPTLFVTFPLFYITKKEIAASVAAKQLQTAVQNEVNSKQLFENQAAGVRRVTDTFVNDLNNNATLIREQAIAASASLVRMAQANASQIVQQARIAGGATVFADLQLKTAAEKEKLDWLFLMLQRKDIKLRLGYQPQLVTVTGRA